MWWLQSWAFSLPHTHTPQGRQLQCHRAALWRDGKTPVSLANSQQGPEAPDDPARARRWVLPQLSLHMTAAPDDTLTAPPCQTLSQRHPRLRRNRIPERGHWETQALL